jgi:hypothetical protein
LSSLLLALAVGAPTRAADTSYKIQRIVQYGDTVGGVPVRVNNGEFTIYGLTDSEQIAFSTWVDGFKNGAAVMQYAGASLPRLPCRARRARSASGLTTSSDGNRRA